MSSFESSDLNMMSRSKLFAFHELVPLLCSAISRAIAGNNGGPEEECSPKSTIDKAALQPNTWYRFGNVLQVADGQTTFDTWGTLTMRLGSDISPAAAAGSSSPHHYYIIGKIRHGQTANVYHGLDANGSQVAIKIFVNPPTVHGWGLDAEDLKTAEAKPMEREKERLLKFYPFLSGKVHLMTLSDEDTLYRCIVMPFFRPVAMSERHSIMPDIEKTLRTCFFANLLAYHRYDICWGQVGIYQDDQGEEHCILCDLVELQELEEGVDVESILSEHMEIWRDNISIEWHVGDEMFAHEKL
jgi:hypothetical protein